MKRPNHALPTVFNNLFFEDNFNMDSLGSDWTLVKYQADKIENC
jgi:hypothetical protein